MTKRLVVGAILGLLVALPAAPARSSSDGSGAIISGGPSGKAIKRLFLSGRGERLRAGATTDVWTLGKYAYTGTFSRPCGGNPKAGVWVWEVKRHKDPEFVTVIPSPRGSRANDVKAASMNSGDILVHSNESCAGGRGGFEIYDVDDPRNPVHLAHVQTDDVNMYLRDAFGFVGVGVHNLFLFTQGDRDYVAAVVESEFGRFQMFDITDPTNPSLVGFWGSEEIRMAELGEDPSTVPDLGAAEFGLILQLNSWLFSGFGASRNRFLHDITITQDGTRAYLANWDAGLILLDISDLTDPQVVSVALDPTSEDGEVNSHAAWPSEDGRVVVEAEEDFAPFATSFSIDTAPNAGSYPSSEGTFTTPIVSLPWQSFSGWTTYVGLACTGGDVPAGSGIALIQRGACRFDLKATHVIAAGYDAMVVFSDATRGDALVRMGGAPRAIPGTFVGHSTGLAIAGVPDAASLVIGAPGADVTAAVVPNGWSGFRIWDYSDPTAPVLASTFNTVCSADPIDPSCDPAGTYSSHNVIVETKGKRTLAYVSWYSNGLLVLDVTDAYHPREIARYFDDSPEFLESNGGRPHDFWGVYKEPGKPWIYGADRNGGLYIFKLKGGGAKAMP